MVGDLIRILGDKKSVSNSSFDLKLDELIADNSSLPLLKILEKNRTISNSSEGEG